MTSGSILIEFSSEMNLSWSVARFGVRFFCSHLRGILLLKIPVVIQSVRVVTSGLIEVVEDLDAVETVNVGWECRPNE